MIKKALKSAIGISIGLTFGGVVLPRLMFPEFYNHTYPPLLKQILIYFLFSYAVCFLTSLLINWIKIKLNKES